jgi:hypothetical protein
MDSTLSIAVPGTLAATQIHQVSAEDAANANSGGPSPSAGVATQAQYPAVYAAQQAAALYDFALNVLVMRIYSRIVKSPLDIET